MRLNLDGASARALQLLQASRQLALIFSCCSRNHRARERAVELVRRQGGQRDDSNSYDGTRALSRRLLARVQGSVNRICCISEPFWSIYAGPEREESTRPLVTLIRLLLSLSLLHLTLLLSRQPSSHLQPWSTRLPHPRTGAGSRRTSRTLRLLRRDSSERSLTTSRRSPERCVVLSLRFLRPHEPLTGRSECTADAAHRPTRLVGDQARPGRPVDARAGRARSPLAV